MKVKRKEAIVIREEDLKYKDRFAFTIIVFLNLLPFCVFSHVEQLPETAQQYFQNTNGYIADFFLYHKEKLLVIFAVWLILFFIGEHIYPKNPARDIPLRSKTARVTLLCVGIYAVTIVLSTVFAEDGQTALWGSCTEYEGMMALLAYLVLFLAGYNYFRGAYRREMLKKGLVVFMTVLSVLAVVESCYKPIYEIGFMKYLIAPPEYREMAAGLSNVGFQGKTVLSFYNPGYLGGLCAMLIPIGFGFAYEEEKRPKRICYLLLNAGLWFTLLGTGVTGAFFAAAAGMIILFLSLRKDKKKLLSNAGIWILVMLLMLVLANLVTKGAVADRIFAVVTNEDKIKKSDEYFAVEEMELTDGRLRVSSGKGTFFIGKDVIEDEAGKEIPMELGADGVLHLLPEKLKAVSLTYDGRVLALDLGYEDTVDFYVTEDGLKLVGQNGMALDEIPQSRVKRELLKKCYPLATGRGYMWANTLPILKECILIGKGPGNFAYAFVQNEVVGLLNTHGSYKFVIDKPHSWYLQTAVSTGVISLLAVLVLIFRYLGRGIVTYCIQNKKQKVFEKALWSGLFAFCITGLVNDSIVAVNPIFWLLFGVGSCAVDNNK